MIDADDEAAIKKLQSDVDGLTASLKEGFQRE